MNDDEYEKNEDFYIQLGEPIWHREMSSEVRINYGQFKRLFQDEGIEGKPVLGLSRCKVVITEDKEFKAV